MTHSLAASSPAARSRHIRLPLVVGVTVLLGLAGGSAAGVRWMRRSLETTAPPVRSIDVPALFVDATPVTIVHPAAGGSERWLVTADDIRLNATLWSRMHLADWNSVPSGLLEEGLERLLVRNQRFLMSPHVWDDGDLDLAIRAYHRGISAAGDDYGTAYLTMVRRRLSRFIRNQDAPPAWDYVWRRDRELERREWPWMAARRARGARKTSAGGPPSATERTSGGRVFADAVVAQQLPDREPLDQH